MFKDKSKGLVNEFVIDSDFNQCNGYGDLSRNFTRVLNELIPIKIHSPLHYHGYLNELGYGKQIIKGNPTIISSLSIQPTFSLMRPPIGQRNAIFTMFESSKLRPEWIQRINSFDLCLTPSTYNKAHFSDQLSIPVAHTLMGYDQKVYSFHQSKSSGPFVFGAAGHVGHGRARKGIERIIDWFQSAFPKNKDVRLKIKINAWDENDLAANDERIEVIEKDISETACRDWLRSLHCYVDGSTSEGWGMWTQNAMATGNAVICTNYSARNDYLKFGNHIPIGYRLVQSSDQYKGLGHWAMPDRSDAIEAMRWAFKNRNQCRKIGKTAYESVKHMTWESSAKLILTSMKKTNLI